MQIAFKNFVIEKSSADHIQDIQYLFSVAFNIQVSSDLIREKNINSPSEHKFLGFIAYESETREPAAYYAVYPLHICYKDDIILAGQAGDAMTNPKFQKQGLFIKVAEITLEYCKKIGIDLIYGFPNSSSIEGQVKYLGYAEAPRFLTLHFVENPFEIYRFIRRSKVALSLQQSFLRLICNVFFRKCDFFENSNHLDSQLGYVVHDKEYFAFKKKSKNILIHFRGIKIWLKVKLNSIVIADMDIGEHSSVDYLHSIKILRLLTYLTGYRFLSFSSSPNSYLHKKLDKISKMKIDANRIIINDFKNQIPNDQLSLLLCDADYF